MSDTQTHWTPAQRAGVTTTGQSLLLSAAAGSGKTSVLTGRVVHLICKAQPACEIDEILVVAFNEAAAAEMKGRILKELQSTFIADPTERMARQVALADRASISTLHAFCSRLLRQHFHRVGLDPNFNVMDAEEASLLRREVVREIFAKRYESDANGTFQSLIDCYGDGDDERLVSQVLKVRELLTSVLLPEAWRTTALARLDAAATLPLADSEFGREFISLIHTDLDLLAGKIESAIAVIRPMKCFDYYVSKLTEWRSVVQHLKRVLANESFDDFAREVASLSDSLAEKAKAYSNSLPGKELAKGLFDEIKDHLRDGSFRDATRFDEAGWQKTVADTLTAARVLLELVGEFDQCYQEHKSQLRAVDFSDLERFALTVLSAQGSPVGARPSDVARAYHKRFKYVLVDEYQDINEVQDAILRLVSRECVYDHATPSNFFCVGDVKQSIYSFRLAEPQRFLDRDRGFRTGSSGVPGRVIDLQENFRSRAPLLEAINVVFRRLMTRESAGIDYDASHELKPGAQYPPPGEGDFTGKPIELHLLPSQLTTFASESNADIDDLEQDEYEASLVAMRILALTGRNGVSPPMKVTDRQGDSQVTRDIRLGDIVILLRSRVFTANRYADLLRRWGIAAHADGGTGFFERQEIRDMLALLHVLDNQQQDIPLAALLRSPIGTILLRQQRSGVGDSPLGIEDELATIRLAYQTAKPPVPFHQAVTRYAAEQSDALAAALRASLDRLRVWREAIHQRPVADVVRSIYDDTGLLAYYAGLPYGNQRVANLEALYDRSTQFGTFARQGLSRFLRFLENLESDSDVGEPSLDAQGSDVVRIMTVHQSKGLEFPVVILSNLGRRFNRLSTSGMILSDRAKYLGMETVDQQRLIYYPSLSSTVLVDSIAAQATAEEIRILYVALTRAREHLILIGSTTDKSHETALARWTGHHGPLPVHDIRSAGSFVDWLLPIAIAEGPNVIEVTVHPAEEILSITESQPDSRRSPDALKAFAKLTPMPSVARDSTVDAVIERLSYVYPHEPATATPAARSVTGWTKQGPPAVVPDEAEPRDTSPDPSSLELPRFLSQDIAPKATDLGTFTHLVLEHFNYDPSAPDLEGQIQSLVDRQLLTQSQAKLIDRDSIRWFLATPLGQRIRNHVDRLKRELPVYFSANPLNSTDRADEIMLRGRLDGFLDLPTGGVVFDYKTDRVSGERLEQRTALYSPQIRAYANAISAITGRPLAEGFLIFLHDRKVVPVSIMEMHMGN